MNQNHHHVTHKKKKKIHRNEKKKKRRLETIETRRTIQFLLQVVRINPNQPRKKFWSPLQLRGQKLMYSSVLEVRKKKKGRQIFLLLQVQIQKKKGSDDGIEKFLFQIDLQFETKNDSPTNG